MHHKFTKIESKSASTIGSHSANKTTYLSNSWNPSRPGLVEGHDDNQHLGVAAHSVLIR